MSQENVVWMDRIKGVLTEDGIKYTGSEEAYLKFLRTFKNTIDRKSNEIEKSFKDGNLKFCTIKIHALKSTARIIGAGKLSELASEMEIAGKKEDFGFLDAHMDELLQMYRSYKENLKDLPKEEMIINKSPISQKELDEAYSALKRYAEDMDYDAVKMIIDEMNYYILPDDYSDTFETVNRKLLEFDWDGIYATLEIE